MRPAKARPLVPYAGMEANERSKGHYEACCDRAYDHFTLGRSSLAVAKLQRISEAAALKRITIGRCRALDLPDPYKSEVLDA